MYMYQEKTIEEIVKACEKLEEKTESRKTLRIGFMRDEFWFTSKYLELKGDLLIRLNYEDRFKIIDGNRNICRTFNSVDKDAFISINKDIFAEIVQWIDEIYEENKERKSFHEELNKQLEALNKSL